MAQRGALQTMFALVSKLAKREDKDKEAERKSNNNIYVSPPQDFKVIFHMSPLDAQRIMGQKIITEAEEPATVNTCENENTAQPDAYLRPDRPLVLRPPSIALPQPPNTYCGSEVSTRTNIEMIALSRGWISMDELNFDNSVDGSLNSTYDDNDDVYTYIDEDDEELAAIGRRRSASRASLPASVIPNPHGQVRRHNNGSIGSEPWCPEQLPMDAAGIPRLPQQQHQQRLFVKKADRKCESVVAAKINARFRQQADGRAMSKNNMSKIVDNLNVSLPTTPRPQLSPKPARIVQHLPSQILRPTILIPMSEVSEDRDTFPSVKVDVEHQIRHQSLCSAGNELLLPPEQPPPPPRSVSRMSSNSPSPSPSSPPKAGQLVNELRNRLSISPASIDQMQHQSPSRNDQRSPSRAASPRPPSRGELRPPSRQPSPPPPPGSGGQRSPSRQQSPRSPSRSDLRSPSPRPPSRSEVRAPTPQTLPPSPSIQDKPSRKSSPRPPSRNEMLPPPLPLSSPPGSGNLVKQLTNSLSTSPGLSAGSAMVGNNQTTSNGSMEQRSQFTFNRAYVGEEKNRKLHVAAQATNNAYLLSREGKSSVTVPQRSPERPLVSPKPSRLLSPTLLPEKRAVARRSNAKQSTSRRSQDDEIAHNSPAKHQANSASRHSPPDRSRLLGPSNSTPSQQGSQQGSQSGRTRPTQADKAVSNPGPMRTEPMRLPGAPTLTASVQRNPSRFEMESTISKASKLFGVRLNHVDKGSTGSASSNEGSSSLNHRMLTRSQATPLTERPPAWSIWQLSNSPVSPSPTSSAQKPRTPPKPM